MENAERDDNRVTTLLGVDDVTGLPAKVRLDSNGRILVSAVVSGLSFLDLTDTPNSYTGQSGKGVRVNATEDGLEFYATSSGVGDVVGPASSTDNAVARFDSTTGKLIQNSTVLIGDTGNVTEIGDITGKSGGITITGGTASGDDIRITSTSNATKGTVNLGSATTGIFLDETTGYFSIGKDSHALNAMGMSFPIRSVVFSESADELVMGVVVAGSDTGSSAQIIGARSRGTLASPTIVQDTDSLFEFGAAAYDGTTHYVAATIRMQIDGTPGSGATPGAIVFLTSPSGTGNPIESFRITNDQNLRFVSGVALQTGKTNADTLRLQAYDVDGAAYTTFATLTAGNTPTMDLSDSVTKASNYIYRAGGTDVPVTDGGLGVSSLTAYAPIFGGTTSTGAVQSGTVGSTGQVLTSNGAGALPTFQTLTSSGIPDVISSLFVVNASVIPTQRSAGVMTGGGRYILFPGTTEWRVWDSYASGKFVYNGYYEYARTGLTISPEVATRVMSSSTEYIIASAAGGTSLYRYNADGQTETAITISGTTLTGCRRLGYDETTGYVYMQDGANQAATTVKRFTFSGSTLTYVDTITLSAAPANAGSTVMWVGTTNLCFVDAYSVTNKATWQRYGKNSGTQTSSKDFGTPNVNTTIAGWCVRQSDNAVFQWHEVSADLGSTGFNISARLDA